MIFSNYQRRFRFPKLPDCFWGPPGVLGYRGLFPRGQRGRCMMLTTPSKAGDKNANICTSIPSYVLILFRSIEQVCCVRRYDAAELCDNSMRIVYLLNCEFVFEYFCAYVLDYENLRRRGDRPPCIIYLGTRRRGKYQFQSQAPATSRKQPSTHIRKVASPYS